MTPVLRGFVAPTRSRSAATPLLVLGPSLGTTASTWDAALPLLTQEHRVLRVDLPGHGLSPAARSPFTVGDLAEAVVTLVDSVGGGRFAYAGVSLGGAVGIELALGGHSTRLDALALVCSGARIGDSATWERRAALVRAEGTVSLVDGSARRWFAPSFAEREGRTVARALAGLVEVDDESYALCCEALAGFDRSREAGQITVPALVVTGDADTVVTDADGEALAAALPRGEHLVLGGVAHQANLEAPQRLARAVMALVRCWATPMSTARSRR